MKSITNKIKILEASNTLGLGGTEYALQLYCKYLNKNLFEVKAVGVFDGGPREKLIEKLGVEVFNLNGDLDKFTEHLKETDVLHWHGSGSIKLEILEILKRYKPKLVIQTNVFGFYDNPKFYSLIDYDLYISKMILFRRMNIDKKLGKKFNLKRKVLYYPVDIDDFENHTPTLKEIENFKLVNNLNNKFIIGRIGRADDNKFDLITLDGFALFAKNKENVLFFLIGQTPNIVKHAKKLNILDKIVFFENTSDFKTLLLCYNSLNIFVAASNIGESFGMVIAEAMTAGVPVVTINTPDRDNAQIELVDNNLTGLVVPRLDYKISEALEEIYTNKNLAQFFSANSKDKVLKNYYARNIISSLENLILTHFKINNSIEQSLIIDYNDKLINEYSYRLNNNFTVNTFNDKINLKINDFVILSNKVARLVRKILFKKQQ